MTTRSTIAAIVATLPALACNGADGQAAGGEPKNEGQVERRDIADLPRLSRNGTDYPYIGYAESTGQTASRGRVFFLHPMMDQRNELLALEYQPGMRLEGLFAEDLPGTGGLVVNEDGRLRIEFMPVSLPRAVRGGQEWPMQYANRQFACRSRSTTGDQISVACVSAPYTLSFTFTPERGITEFQDFCDHAICTFRLVDPVGLLSRATLAYMGLSGD